MHARHRRRGCCLLSSSLLRVLEAVAVVGRASPEDRTSRFPHISVSRTFAHHQSVPISASVHVRVDQPTAVLCPLPPPLPPPSLRPPSPAHGQQRVRRNDQDGLWHATPSPLPPSAPPPPPPRAPDSPEKSKGKGKGKKRSKSKGNGDGDGDGDGGGDGEAGGVSSSLVMVLFDIPHLVRTFETSESAFVGWVFADDLPVPGTWRRSVVGCLLTLSRLLIRTTYVRRSGVGRGGPLVSCA